MGDHKKIWLNLLEEELGEWAEKWVKAIETGKSYECPDDAWIRSEPDSGDLDLYQVDDGSIEWDPESFVVVERHDSFVVEDGELYWRVDTWRIHDQDWEEVDYEALTCDWEVEAYRKRKLERWGHIERYLNKVVIARGEDPIGVLYRPSFYRQREGTIVEQAVEMLGERKWRIGEDE